MNQAEKKQINLTFDLGLRHYRLSNQLIAIFIIIHFLVLTVSSYANAVSDFAEKVKTLTVSQIDTLKIPPTSFDQYYRMTYFALDLSADSSNQDQALKGDILLSVIANHLSEEIVSERVDINSDSLQILCQIYSKHHFLICQKKTSNYLKFVHHLCKGNFFYIYGRANSTKFFFPAVALIFAVVVFSIFSLSGFYKWRFSQFYNRLFTTLIVIFIIAGIIFYSFCDECVTETSFFGLTI